MCPHSLNLYKASLIPIPDLTTNRFVSILLEICVISRIVISAIWHQRIHHLQIPCHISVLLINIQSCLIPFKQLSAKKRTRKIFYKQQEFSKNAKKNLLSVNYIAINVTNGTVRTISKEHY